MKKVKFIDYIFLVWSILAITFYIYSIYDCEEILSSDPFYSFHSNKGIQIHYDISNFLYLIAAIILLISIIKKGFNKNRMIVLSTSLSLLIVQSWLFMWYSSTFYYGEVRDKQGTWFPWVALIYTYYLIYLLPIKQTKYNGLKWVLCILSTILFVALFELVLEPWVLNW